MNGALELKIESCTPHAHTTSAKRGLPLNSTNTRRSRLTKSEAEVRGILCWAKIDVCNKILVTITVIKKVLPGMVIRVTTALI